MEEETSPLTGITMHFDWYYYADDSTLVVLTGTVNLSPQSQPFMGLTLSPSCSLCCVRGR